MKKKKRGLSPRVDIGWRELVGLPQLSIPSIRAKIDTGARTSAIHATDIKTFEIDGSQWVEFHVPVLHSPRSVRQRAPIKDVRNIKNTSGIAYPRFVIKTDLVIGNRHWVIELSLADRADMGFELILGRTAIRGHRMLVDPGRSFLAGPPQETGNAYESRLDDGVMRTLRIANAPHSDAPNKESEL